MGSATTDRRMGLAGNTAYKTAASALAAGNIALSGEQTVGGVAVKAINAAGMPDRVLCVGQTDATTNGLWDVNTGTWTRSVDADGNYDWAQGTQVIIAQGTYAFQIFTLTTANPITVGSTALAFSASLNAGNMAMLAASGGAGLVGFIQSGTGAVARTVQDKARESVSVKDFGAVGNGVIDDTAAIQNAINFLRNTSTSLGGILHFPAGIYRITYGLDGRSITPTDGARRISYIGESMYSSSILYDGTAAISLLSLGMVFTGVESTGFRAVSNLGFNTTDSGRHQTGIHWESADSLGLISYCQLSGFDTGIFFSGSWGNEITGVWVTLCNIGLNMPFQPNASIVKSSDFQQCAVGINAISPYSLTLDTVTIEDTTNIAIAINGGNSIIRNCYFEGAANTAVADIEFAGAGVDDRPSAIVENCFFNDDIIQSAIRAQSARSLTIRNNTVYTPAVNSCLFENISSIGSGDVRHVAIYGNDTNYRPDGLLYHPDWLKYLYKGPLPSQTLDIGTNGEYSEKGLIFLGNSNLLVNVNTAIANNVLNAQTCRQPLYFWNPSDQTYVNTTYVGNSGVVASAAGYNGTTLKLTASTGGYSYAIAVKAIPLAYLQGLFGSSASIGFRMRAMVRNASFCFQRRSGSSVGNLTTSTAIDDSGFQLLEWYIPPTGISLNSTYEFGFSVPAGTVGFVGPIQLEIVGFENWYTSIPLDSY